MSKENKVENKVELNVADIKNLIVLLQRVDLKGNEAVSYVQLMQKLNLIAVELTPKKEEATDKKENK